MMTQHPPLDDPRDTGQRLYTSLLILGLEASALEHSLRTPVNQKMFIHMNKKLGETLLHFIFVCIDREKASKVFRDCWPLIDKKQEAQFHRATFEWYKTLKQSYGQPVPAVVAKTFMVPGGPKFTSTLMTLTRIALHSSLTKKAPDSILHFPTYSRNSELNLEALLLLRASKYAHHRNFIVKQKIRQEVLKSFQDKAKDLCEMYRKLCSENEKAELEFQDTLNSNESLSQNQKDTVSTAPLSLIQKEFLGDITKMNSETSSLRSRIEEFQKNEESSWKIISPLLDGTTSLSHIDGSMYSPQVPEMVYKAHANNINKEGLHGLYHDDKLDLLSLIQYSSLALQCLLVSVHSTNLHTRPDSIEELNIQTGRVTSLNETVNKLSSHLNTLLPSLMESVTTHRRRIAVTVPSLKAVDLGGKPHLCPPTPPLNLVNTPVAIKGGIKYVPLHLTPGVQCPKVGFPQDGFNITPNRLLFTTGITGAAKKSPRANVVYSPATQKDDSIQILAGENNGRLVTEAGLTMDMLTVDCRGRYLRRKEQEKESLQADCNPLPKKQGHKSLIPKRRQRHKESFVKSTVAITKTVVKQQEELEVEKFKKVNMNEERNNIKCNSKTAKEDLDNSLLDRLAETIANEDDSGAIELAGSLCDEVTQDGSIIDSGCVEMLSDSDTLLETIENMDITPRFDQFTLNEDDRPLRGTPGSARKSGIFLCNASTKLNSLLRNTPESCKTQTQGPPTQFARLKDVTLCGPLKYVSNLPNEISGKDFRLPVNKDQVSSITVNDDECVDLVSRNGGSVVKQVEKVKDSSQDLLARMTFLTKTPVKNNTTPLPSKILSKFDGLDFSVDATFNKPTRLMFGEDTSQGCIVEELRHHSKAKLNVLIQQMKQKHSSKAGSTISSRSDVGSKSNFISYVQTIKKKKETNRTSSETDCESVVNCSKLGKTVFSKNNNAYVKDLLPMNPEFSYLNRNEKVVEVKEDFYNRNPLKDHIHDKTKSSSDRNKTVLDVKGDFSSSLRRMQSLLGDDNDDTLTDNVEGKNNEKILEPEENFVNGVDIEKILRSPGRRSLYLPESSLFDTLTDSILTGESDTAILNNEAVKTEIHRESVSSCRQSLASLGRMSMGSSKRLSEVFTAFENRSSVECSGILDESDSCLLSTSMDEF